MKKLIMLFVIALIITGYVFADDNTQTQNVTVNIDLGDLKEALGLDDDNITDFKNSSSIGFGVSTPFFGTSQDIYKGNEKYTLKTNGFNLMLGYTWRTYFGEGLPTNGGAGYFEIFTMALIVPMVGVGFDYRIGENFMVGVGFPDIIHGSISF